MRFYEIKDDELLVFGIKSSEGRLHKDLKAVQFRWDPHRRCWHAPLTEERKKLLEENGFTLRSWEDADQSVEEVFKALPEEEQQLSEEEIEDLDEVYDDEYYDGYYDDECYEEDLETLAALDRENLVNALKKKRHICWYPHAENDLSVLYFLSNEAYFSYFSDMKTDKKARVIPDLFILSGASIKQEYQKKWNEISEDYLDASMEGKAKEPEYPVLTWNGKLKADEVWEKCGFLYDSEHPTPEYPLIRELTGYGLKMKIRAAEGPKKLTFDYDEDGRAYWIKLNIRAERNGRRREWKTELLYIVGDARAFYDKILFCPDSDPEMDVPVETIVFRAQDHSLPTDPKSAWEYEVMFRDLKAKYLVAKESLIKECLGSRLSHELKELVRIKRDWDIDSPMVFYRKKRKRSMAR